MPDTHTLQHSDESGIQVFGIQMAAVFYLNINSSNKHIGRLLIVDFATKICDFCYRSSLENGAGGGGAGETLTKNGSNASGGGSRRKIRPFSPARDRPFSPARPQPNPICLSASAPSPFPKHLVSTAGLEFLI